MGIERRERGRRAEVVKAVVDHVVHRSESTVTLEGLQDFLHIPQEAAGRIVSSLVNAGIVREVRDGVWTRVPEGSPPSTRVNDVPKLSTELP